MAFLGLRDAVHRHGHHDGRHFGLEVRRGPRRRSLGCLGLCVHVSCSQSEFHSPTLFRSPRRNFKPVGEGLCYVCRRVLCVFLGCLFGELLQESSYGAVQDSECRAGGPNRGVEWRLCSDVAVRNSDARERGLIPLILYVTVSHLVCIRCSCRHLPTQVKPPRLPSGWNG